MKNAFCQLLKPGHHLKVCRGLIDHHGVYAGIHGGIPVVVELSKPSDGGVVRVTPLEKFRGGGTVQIVSHPWGLPLNVVVENARRAIGKRAYDPLTWNCEHFATSCATGVAKSRQVESIGCAVLVGIGVLSCAALLDSLAA